VGLISASGYQTWEQSSKRIEAENRLLTWDKLNAKMDEVPMEKNPVCEGYVMGVN